MVEATRHGQQVAQRDALQLRLRVGRYVFGERVDQFAIETQYSFFDRDADGRRHITLRMRIDVTALIGREMPLGDDPLTVRQRHRLNRQIIAVDEIHEIIEDGDGVHKNLL